MIVFLICPGATLEILVHLEQVLGVTREHKDTILTSVPGADMLVVRDAQSAEQAMRPLLARAVDQSK